MAEPFTRIAICGAGAMGAGIAQLAAQFGAAVQVFDLSDAVLAASRERIFASIAALVARGRLAESEAVQLRERLRWTDDIQDLSGSELAIEAIVEDEEAKGQLFDRLECALGEDAVIASNTSSLPIARLARRLRRPSQFIGMHFFNPATVMKLVEIVPGPATAPALAARIHATAQAWGKVAIQVADVPGFIVNRIARPYYAEAFTALTEAAAPAEQIDALFHAAGFRMGPLELTDLIGQDVNFAVARSIHDAYFGRTRFVPQIGQAALVNAGRLGRKTGHGIYPYPAGPGPLPAGLRADAVLPAHQAAADALLQDPCKPVACAGVRISMTRGLSAGAEGRGGSQPVALLDWFSQSAGGPIGFAVSDDRAVPVAEAVIAALGRLALRIRDRPGLIIARTLAQIANAAADAVLEQVADEGGIDSALRNGANYPFGPFAWADGLGRKAVAELLDNIAAETGEAMYRCSYHLRSAS